jgi:hypothetical protein
MEFRLGWLNKSEVQIIMAKRGEPLFTIDLGPNGGRFEPRTIDDFVAWTEAERQKWQWLESSLDERVPTNLVQHVFGTLDAIVNYARSIRDNNNLRDNDPPSVLDGHYGAALPSLYHSTGSTGQAILAIHDQFDGVHAAVAYSLLVGQMPVELRNPLHFKLMSLISNPGLIDGAKYMATVESTFSDVIETSRQIHGEQKDFLTNSKRTWANFSGATDKLAKRAVRRFIGQGRKTKISLATKGIEAIKLINDTRAAYEQQMQLQAAVKYWSDKRDAHSKSRATTFKQLTTYSKYAGVGASAAFLFAIVFMLEASGVDVLNCIEIKPTDGKVLAPSAYVIVTAAVGTVLTCLFWAARVLVRNYLNERRLEADAEERRIMTQTYLALVKQGAAGEEDRLIILNALFRPTGDKASSDEGSNDIALPALLAKLMDQRMPK